MQAGNLPKDLDITQDLIQAVQTVERAQVGRQSVSEIVGQQDAFSGGISPAGNAILKLLFNSPDNYTRPAGRDKIVERLSVYVSRAEKSAQAEGELFGDAPSPLDLLPEAEAGVLSGDLFDQKQAVAAQLTPVAEKESRVEGTQADLSSAEATQAEINDRLFTDERGKADYAAARR